MQVAAGTSEAMTGADEVDDEALLALDIDQARADAAAAAASSSAAASSASAVGASNASAAAAAADDATIWSRRPTLLFFHGSLCWQTYDRVRGMAALARKCKRAHGFIEKYSFGVRYEVRALVTTPNPTPYP